MRIKESRTATLCIFACCLLLAMPSQAQKETKEKVKTETGKEKVKVEEEDGVIKEKTKIKEEGQPTIKEKTKTDAATGELIEDKMKPGDAGLHQDMNHRTDVTGETMPSTYTAYVWSTDKDVWWNPAEVSYHFITTTTVANPNQPVRRDLGTGMNDHSPVFSDACRTEADPLKCTRFEISEGLAMTMYPDSNLSKNHSGVEYVIFTIDEQGTVSNYEVVSQQNRCPGCAQAAVNAVSNLMVDQKWYPATRNGQPVRARVAVPVRFSMTTKK